MLKGGYGSTNSRGDVRTYGEVDNATAGTPQRGSSRKSQARAAASVGCDSSISQDTQFTMFTHAVTQALSEMEAKLEAKATEHQQQMQAQADDKEEIMEARLHALQQQHDDTLNALQREKDHQIRTLQESLVTSTNHLENLIKQVLSNQALSHTTQPGNNSLEDANETMNLSFTSNFYSVNTYTPTRADLEPDIADVSTLNLSTEMEGSEMNSQEQQDAEESRSLEFQTSWHQSRTNGTKQATKEGRPTGTDLINTKQNSKSLLTQGASQHKTGINKRE
jgi:hypothetical protein